MASFGYVLLDRILSGVSVRDAVFESIPYFRNNGDYEAISNEREMMSFSGVLSAFSPELKVVEDTPLYRAYTFQVYCPDLIGPVYDADDPHPLKVKIYLSTDIDPQPFIKALERSFDDGSDVRDSLKFLYAPGDHIFKSMEIEHLR